MQEQSEQAKALLQKYLNGQCTPSEEEAVLRWFYTFDNDPASLSVEEEELLAQRLNKNLIKNTLNQKRDFGIRKVLIAAMALFVMGALTYIYLHQADAKHNAALLATEVPSSDSRNQNDILPGANYAKVIKSNGEERIMQDTTFYAFVPPSTATTDKVAIEVPKSGTYKIVLEDGTKVWLNASTRLSYPEKFTDTERLVTLEGEAYFEVMKDVNRPFRIQAQGTSIEVLGTSFNVDAYGEEVKTSLVEGSVKVKNQSQENTLSPGQASIASIQNIRISDTDLQKSTAWQRGEFYFDGNDLTDIMSQITRWYNVEFENIEALQVTSTYKGAISRNTNLSNVLQILELATGKYFAIKGRKIVIQETEV